MSNESPTQIPQQAAALVARFEGLKLEPYKDPAGVLTIGYGHTGQGVHQTTFTEEDAIKYLGEDLKSAAESVRHLVEVPINENQYAALISFTFNFGHGNLRRSTLLRRLNAGDYVGAANEFQRWVRAGRISLEVLPGLVRRRGAEEQLFRTPPPTTVTISTIMGTELEQFIEATEPSELAETLFVTVQQGCNILLPQEADEKVEDRTV